MYPSYTQPTHSSNSSQSEYDNLEGQQHPPAVHNLYNLNTHRTSRYDSCDELKSPASASSEEQSEYYDSFIEGRVPVPAPPAHILQQQQQQGQDSVNSGQGDQGSLQELTPSRFGSKRESHSDYRDSPYQIVDMPPPPANLQYRDQDLPPPPREAYYDGGGTVGHQEYGIPSSTEVPHQPGNIPYIDSSQSSLASSGSVQYPYRGQGGYESDPSSPAYPPVTHVPTQSPYEAYPPHSGNTPPPPRETVSVTKYQNYVEVSKPFEMADAYKYSERRRKQQHSASQSPQASPYLPRAHGQQHSRPASPYTDYNTSSQRQAYPAHTSPRHAAYTATTPDSATQQAATTPHR